MIFVQRISYVAFSVHDGTVIKGSFHIVKCEVLKKRLCTFSTDPKSFLIKAFKNASAYTYFSEPPFTIIISSQKLDSVSASVEDLPQSE